jgi:hypothetical protein
MGILIPKNKAGEDFLQILEMLWQCSLFAMLQHCKKYPFQGQRDWICCAKGGGRGEMFVWKNGVSSEMVMASVHCQFLFFFF